MIAKLKPYVQKYQIRQEEPILYIDSIHMDRLKVVSATDTTYSDLPFSVYSMFVGSDIPNTLFNIYIEEYPDSTLSAPYVLMYHMDSTFASAYFAGEKGMDNFVGTLSKHEMDVMFGSYLNGQRTIDLEIIIYCLKKVFGDPDGPGGAPGNTPGVGAFPTGTLVSSIPTGGIYWVPDNGGTPCTWHIGAATGTLYIDCTGGKPIPRTLWNGSESDTEARTEYTFEECLRILIMCGIIDERPGIEDGGTTPPEPEPSFGEFLAEELGFVPGTQDFRDISYCLNNSSKQTRMTLAQLLESGVLTDPCNPENSAEEMLHDAVEAGCGNGGGLSVEEIYSELTGMSEYFGFIIDNGLALVELGSTNIDFSDCCVESDFNECAELVYNANSQPNSDGIIDQLDFMNEDYTGDKIHIQDCIRLNDSTEIDVEFGITASDSLSADQEVAECLVDALISALSCTIDSFEITKIYISATTNGKHSATSNHSKALAIDLSRINDIKLSLMTEEELETVRKLQEYLEEYVGIRENFGPSMKKKLGQDYNAPDHDDHVHFSVNSDATCDFEM